MCSYSQVSTHKDNGEVFIFRYQPGQEADLIAEFARLAANEESDFDWFDAAVLSYEIGRRLETNLPPGLAA